MKLGFVSAIVPDLPLLEVLQFAADVGYDCVEVMCWPPSKADRRYAGVTHIDVTKFGAKEAESVQAAVEQTGTDLSGLGYYPNPLSRDKEEAKSAIAHLRKVIAAANKLGLANVNTFVGRDWTKSVEENWPQFLKTWKPLIAYAEEQQVRIGIENCPMLFSQDEWPGGKNLATSPAIWERMFADIPSEFFGLNYDPSHLVWQHMDYLAPLQEFSHKLFHIHAKDVRIDWAHLDRVGIMAHPSEYHTPKLPGMGDVNWGQFFSILTDVGFQGSVCVEVEDRAYERSLAARKQSLWQSATYLRNFIPPQIGDE